MYRFLQLLQAQPAATPGQPPGVEPDPNKGFMMMIMMLGAMFAIWWFLVLRPQKKERDALQRQLDGLKKNDRVLTTAGIYASVHAVRDNLVVLKIDEDSDAKMRVTRNSIAKVLTGDEEKEKAEEKKK